MNIGQVANASGISAKMVRYYEAIGLIPPAKRRQSGYRQYDLSDVHRLRLVRIARDSGISLTDIRETLALWDDREKSNAEIKSLALAKIGELEKRLEQMDAMIETLRTLVKWSNRERGLRGSTDHQVRVLARLLPKARKRVR